MSGIDKRICIPHIVNVCIPIIYFVVYNIVILNPTNFRTERLKRNMFSYSDTLNIHIKPSHDQSARHSH